jgi:hypothetical protein
MTRISIRRWTHVPGETTGPEIPTTQDTFTRAKSTRPARRWAAVVGGAAVCAFLATTIASDSADARRASGGKSSVGRASGAVIGHRPQASRAGHGVRAQLRQVGGYKDRLQHVGRSAHRDRGRQVRRDPAQRARRQDEREARRDARQAKRQERRDEQQARRDEQQARRDTREALERARPDTPESREAERWARRHNEQARQEAAKEQQAALPRIERQGETPCGSMPPRPQSDTNDLCVRLRLLRGNDPPRLHGNVKSSVTSRGGRTP